ncbi:hypothetical protein HanIR_Chr01g0037831 [Helianthus annuus]|nr:hypothetical protein HanIR_Chr01g0037831 [Helianthus annuus]
MDNVLSFVSLPIVLGKEPDILVSAKPRTVRLTQFPISSGIFPVRSLLPPARITSRFPNRPMSGGMLPEILLSNKKRFLRFLQLPI